MPSRTPSEAYYQFIDPIQRALNFITVGRLALSRGSAGLRVGFTEGALLNNGDAAPLRAQSLGLLVLSVGYQVRINPVQGVKDRFECQLIEYWYIFQN
jgi:hypothetical protein